MVAAIVKILSALASILPACVELLKNWRLAKNEAEEKRQRDAVARAIAESRRVPVAIPADPASDAGPRDSAAQSSAVPSGGAGRT